MEEDLLMEKEKWLVAILIWKILEAHVEFMEYSKFF